jgi:hypothetical protein
MAGNVQKYRAKDGITFNDNKFSARGNNGKSFRPGKDYRVGGTFSRRR